ncbi:SdrD B-like domain-containing protein [Thermophagus sp. OGC60D27]|uniref:SdrD B-like domain-containing protein n=1 Tax=Thermophagus sp. OGC60D27 TaxID=3458415 RepID=UPI004037BD3B
MKKIIFLGFLLVSLLGCEADEGRIVGFASANDGDILSEITVKLYNMDAEIIETTTTDSNGKFVFSGLKSGNYYIGATVTVDGKTYDTGGTPQIVYVSDEISKEVTLTLILREE